VQYDATEDPHLGKLMTRHVYRVELDVDEVHTAAQNAVQLADVPALIVDALSNVVPQIRVFDVALEPGYKVTEVTE